MENELSAVPSREQTKQSKRATDTPTPAGRSGDDDLPEGPRSQRGETAPVQPESSDVTRANQWNRTRYGLYAPIYAVRRIEPMLEGTDLVLGPRDSFLGGRYTVTIARPALEL